MTMTYDHLPVRLAEGVEAEFMTKYVGMAPPEINDRLGIATARIGGGTVLSVREDPAKFWSKALGFGFEEPVTDDLIGRVVDFYREQDSPGAVLQLAPSVLPPGWDEICARHGLEPGPYSVKLACRVEDFWPGHSDLHVGPLPAEAALEWATTAFRGFGMPVEGLAEMLAGGLADPDFHPYAAWDGDTIVATGNLLVRDGVASLNAGATLPSHRNRGAQSALLAARAKEAAALGCRWLVAETGLPARGVPNPSLNNMLRAGLRPLYCRRDWTWRPRHRTPSGTE